MKFKNPVSLAAIFGAGILVTTTRLPQAHGDLVYEEPIAQSTVTAPATAPVNADEVRADDRQNLRQVISASQKAQNADVQAHPAAPVVQVQPVATAPVLAQPVYAPAPAAVVAQQTSEAAPAAAGTPEVENLSKAELMRRERVRTELKNEDVLQERLEELRLRDEKRRTDELIAGKPLDETSAAPAAAAIPAPALQNQVVVAPPSEVPGQPGAPVIAPVASAYPNPNPGQPIYTDQVTSTAAMTTSVANSPEEGKDKTTFLITPKIGVSNINVNSAFQVNSALSTGISLGVQATDNIAFELGYSYNQYGINVASSNPWIAQEQAYMSQYNGQNAQTLNLNQNVFEAGLKFSLLGPDSRVRPFLGAGGAYSKGYLNYSQQYQQAVNPVFGGYGGASPDYDVSQFLGYLEGGMDVKITKSISVGASFKYYTVLTSDDSGNLAYGGFYGYGYNNPYYYGGNSPFVGADKSMTGAALSASSFYTISGDLSFTF